MSVSFAMLRRRCYGKPCIETLPDSIRPKRRTGVIGRPAATRVESVARLPHIHPPNLQPDVQLGYTERRCITFTYPAAALTQVLVRWWCSRGLAGNQMHQVRDQGRSPRFATPHHSRRAEIDESGMGAARAVVQIWPPSVHGQSTTCGGQRS